jgi:hypothetical protein
VTPSAGVHERVGSALDRAIPPEIRPDAEFANRRNVLSADIPSGGAAATEVDQIVAEAFPPLEP